jgi:hypothetical protein
MTASRRSAPPLPSRRAPLRPDPLAACLAAALALQAGVLCAGAPPAAPAGAVTVQNCDDAGPGSLREAIAGAADGAVVDLTGLGCGQITLASGALVVAAANLTVRGPGAGALTLSGGDADRVFDHPGSGTLSLSGLTLTHGRAAGDGGCIRSAGQLALTAVTVAACAAGDAAIADVSGGAVAVQGDATIADSTFDGNTADGTARVRGGAVFAGGAVSASGSHFTNNRAWSHDGGGNFAENVAEGGAILSLGALALADSTVSGNTAQSDTYEAFGGGLSAGSHADDVAASLDVQRSDVSGNTVESSCGVCAPQGGGIVAVGEARLRWTRLTGNRVGSANHYGGAGGLRAFDAASLEIADSTISGNHADSAGGGLIGPEQGVVAIETTLVSGNFAGNQGGTNEGGGGVLCFGCAVELTASTVSGNVAEAAGGGITVRYGEYAPSPTRIVGSTISGNTGYEGGGLMLDGGNAQISNATIAFNTASSRGAGVSASEYAYQIELQSTIVAANLTGDAANNVWAFPDAVSGANNLVPNAPGLPAQMPPDTLTGDPLLLPLADNGGPTPTHALGDGSPAIDAGNNAIGLAFDQRGKGFAREVGAAADIGAYEQQDAGTDVIFEDGFED